ncbi:MAG: DUF1080 domain-containing protein [Planctomycetes bacterium]|nr:DUF1080 domain-containing protein [Planctomycetota bacterium]
MTGMVIVSALLVLGGEGPAGEGGGWVSLFNGKDLTGWTQINGTATYEAADGAIVGTTAEGSPNSFLCTVRHYEDFELTFEVQVDPRLNSGVQIRSNSFEDYRNGRVHGYQVEIATSNAGRIYDEARRAKFLDEERKDEKARGAFKADGWNAYRILCVGDSIKTWVNGIPIADLKDDMTKKGFIGLQVHSFRGDPPARVRWRNLRIRDLTAAAQAKAYGEKIAHNVYFALKDSSEGARKKLVDACYEYLKDHPGVVFFAAGVLAEELDRPVNVRDFHVALHVVFDSLAHQNLYQDAEAHKRFIAENSENWESVRVFDSRVR